MCVGGSAFVLAHLQELVDRIKKLGVDYDEAHAKDMERLEKSNSLLANFDPADFSYGLASGQVVHKTTGATLEGVPSAKEVDGADKAALQGYGRPYVDGKPGGVLLSSSQTHSPLKFLPCGHALQAESSIAIRALRSPCRSWGLPQAAAPRSVPVAAWLRDNGLRPALNLHSPRIQSITRKRSAPLVLVSRESAFRCK